MCRSLAVWEPETSWDASAFKVADIYKTQMCPLAKVMRRELKKRHVKKLKVVYSEEKPTRPIEDMAISCRNHCICPPGAEHKCHGEKRYSGKCGICAICSWTDYRRGSSEGPLCKIKIKSRTPLRGAYQNQAFAVRTCSKCLAFLFHFFSQISPNLHTFYFYNFPVIIQQKQGRQYGRAKCI